MRLRRPAPPVDVRAGEKVLAHAAVPDSDDVVAGTREALYLPGGRRVPWEQVEAADWDKDSEQFRVSEVGTWGAERPAYTFTLGAADRLLQLVRERVTSTILLQRHVQVHGKRGLRVIARRAPSGAREVSWLFEYDDGVDPDDPLVELAAREALAAARDEVGDR